MQEDTPLLLFLPRLASGKHSLPDMWPTAHKFSFSILILNLCSLASAGPLSRSPCELLPVGVGHPVQAMLKIFTAQSGCASRGTTTLPQEVHVINLQKSHAQRFEEKPAEVALHLQPIQSLPLHQKPLVFVLNSPQPVLWKLRTEKLAPGVKRIFHVADGSDVQFEEGNFSQSCEVKEENLPHDNEHLLTWAHQRYHAVTSFSEFKMTQDVYIKVGEDSIFSETCKINNKFLSLNYLASYIQDQPSTGCVLSGPDHDQEVHIIELQAPNSSSAFQVDVIVDIRPLDGDAPLHRDVVLLLKCVKSVNWVIKVHSVIGKLDIVTSDSVRLSESTERLMQVSKTVKQQLPEGPQALIKWAEENKFKPVTSYTKTPVANHFNLRLREQDLGIMDDGMFPPELSILRNANPLPKPSIWDSPVRTGLPFHFLPSLEKGLPLPPLSPSLEEGPEEQQGATSIGFNVQCEKNKMVVSIDKETLKANGFGKANITLQDSQCKATSNTTHYILETPLSGCQTTKYPFQPSPAVLYINSIVISQSEQRDGSGWPVDYEDLEPGDIPGDLEVTERILPASGHRTTILFNCTYRKNQDTPVDFYFGAIDTGVDSLDNVTFNMELYNNPFRYSSTQSFLTISENKPIYVEISATKADPNLGFMIQTCFISPDSNPLMPSEYVIIENICPKDDSVLYYPHRDDFPIPHAQTDRKRFSFTYRSKFNVSLLFLHCEMSLCSRRNEKQINLPECMLPDEACTSLSLENILHMMMNTKTFSKPMVVISDNTPVTVKVPEETNPGHPGIIYFLDTPTVVGIAFAAFLIGALLTGALWFIYSHTGDIAAKQQVPKSQSVSENSSAAQSIDSTQSTPCSSSSNA
ncbi:transforming growth factor beta receptor type 3-like [Xyrauchen texanus]|uniref:transforming growth factor beta receptor type 3-like n=1 Tax=Xyrauchen texanus TaxID=154827 RepID=UPI002241BF7F|nr:transforming growth factor beta receptor type 3-like [Xyrauchen texanus]